MTNHEHDNHGAGYHIDDHGAAVCDVCGTMVSAEDGTCLNVGACYAADRAATPSDTGAAMAQPAAWTIAGNID